jgi:hypothetical protein
MRRLRSLPSEGENHLVKTKDESKYAVFLDGQNVSYLRVGFAENGNSRMIVNNGKVVDLVNELDAASVKSRGLQLVANASILDAAKSYLKPLNTSVTITPRAQTELQNILKDKEIIAMATATKKKVVSAPAAAPKAKAGKVVKAAKAASKNGAGGHHAKLEDKFAVAKKIIGQKKEMPFADFVKEMKKTYPTNCYSSTKALVEAKHLKKSADGTSVSLA